MTPTQLVIMLGMILAAALVVVASVFWQDHYYLMTVICLVALLGLILVPIEE